MTQSNFVNPNGLPAENHVTSARDLGILARALIREFPEDDSYWHIHSIRYGNRVMHNYNSLIDRYPGADGMKTGFICASGYNVVASATRNGRRLIAIVLGAYSGATRSQKAAQLLERGFNGNGLAWLTPSLGTVDAELTLTGTQLVVRVQANPGGAARLAAQGETFRQRLAAAGIELSGLSIREIGGGAPAVGTSAAAAAAQATTAYARSAAAAAGDEATAASHARHRGAGTKGATDYDWDLS